MSERRLKLGHRKEYKRKSKHTRNPSYYPRHLTKVTLADFDADFNLRVSKEVAAQRGYGRKVLDKSCHIAWDHGYGYVKITVNHGYGQLYPLVKRIDYERTIQKMAREASM